MVDTLDYKLDLFGSNLIMSKKNFVRVNAEFSAKLTVTFLATQPSKSFTIKRIQNFSFDN